jgi:hypothetical protein
MRWYRESPNLALSGGFTYAAGSWILGGLP